MATTVRFKERVCFYSIHLPTSWAPDELWVARVQDIEEDIRAGEEEHERQDLHPWRLER